MIFRELSPWRPVSLLAILVAMAGLLASGCVWGVVRDADTGAPIAGAKVVTWDCSLGGGRSTVTDANGVYVFDAVSDKPVASGTEAFSIKAAGFESLIDLRTVEYNDNPSANLNDPNTFWEVQSFEIAQGSGRYRDAAAGFSMTLPLGWDTIQIEPPCADPSAEKTRLRAVYWGDTSGYSMNCEVLVDQLQPGVTVEGWWEANRIASTPVVEVSYKKLEQSMVGLAGQQAMRIVYLQEFVFPGGYEDSDKGLIYLMERGQQVWAIDCDTEPVLFGQAEPVFDGIAQSFQFE